MTDMLGGRDQIAMHNTVQREERSRRLRIAIAAFEEWQQSDDSDGFPAIHVAYLLSREPKTPKAED